MTPYNYDIPRSEAARVCDRTDLAPLRGRTVLITGANGLIGGFLADVMCALNDNEGYGINIFLTSYSAANSAQRLHHVIDRPDVNYFSWDCSTPVPIDKLPAVIDCVFFCSGYGQPSKFLSNNIKTSLINVVGVESLLSYMHTSAGGSFLFLSTSEIYGDPPDHMLPTPESYGGSYSLENNREAYKVSKKMGEVICKEYNNAENMRVRIARVALSYGPGVLKSDERVLQEFIFKAQKHNTIAMLDDGSAIRNYLYITDSAEYLLNILLYGRELVYNIGGDTEPTTIYSLAQTVAGNFDASVEKGPTRPSRVKSAPKNVGLDMTRYKTEFKRDDREVTSLERGISATIQWFNFEGETSDN